MFTALQKKTIITLIFCLWNLSSLHAMDQDRGYERLIVTNNATDKFYSSLQHACLAGDEKTVEQYIKEKYWDVKTTITTYDRKYSEKIPTSLHLATQKGHVRIIEKLLNAKADINSTHCTYDATPLHTAVWCEQPDCVEILMQRGADPIIPNCDGNTPVHLAAFTKNLQCLVKFLKPTNTIIHRYSLCTTKNKKGETPLDFAKMVNFTAGLQKLQEVIDSFLQLEQLLGDH